MSRLIFLFAVAAVVYWLLKSYAKKPPKKDEAFDAEDMVRCSQCGVHLPKSESILAGGHYYCSEAHRRENTDGKK
jgi:uncharacterized protein